MANIVGTIYNDLRYGTYYDDRIEGLTGNDELYGGSGGDDIIIAGPDNPVAGYTDDDVVYGDTFRGGNTNDTIYGGYGNDTLYGDSYEGQGGGNDTLDGGLGNDLLVGGDGNDVLGGGSGNDTLYGGAGYDAATYSEQYTKYNATFTRDGAVQITGSEGTDLLHGIERIYFGDGGFYNVYVGDAGANSLTADPNVWSLLYGGDGNDTLTGGNYNDTLTGGNGNDTLYGGSGYDIATYFGQHTSYGASFTSNGAVRITGSEGTDLLHGIERIYFGDGGFYNVYTGDESNNSLAADPNVWSLLYGGDGNDALTGSNYNDTLTGGKGNDILIGGNGKDILTGGSGKDTLYGGSGADKFRFDFKTEGIDIIKDFNRTEGDKIEIVKSSFGATSLSQFSYNSTTGALLFGSTQLATIGNKPAGFSVQGDVVLV